MTRVFESEPQTQHKVELIGAYYGQYPEILIAASVTNPRIDATHIWLIEACAGAGTYSSAEHPDGFVPGCAIQACLRAREIQRRHPNVTMHVVLIEADADYCAELSKLILEFTEASGRDRLDVHLESGRFEDKVADVLARTRKRDGRYYHSLWFLDPDGVVEIPHAAIERIAAVGRGPEIVINLSAGGLARLLHGATLKPGVVPHAAFHGQRKSMNAAFGSDSWTMLPAQPSWELEVYRLADAYAKTFPPFTYQLHKLRTRGDEIRYMVHLSHSAKALEAFDRAYQTSQRTGLLKGAKLTDAEKARHAAHLIGMMPKAEVSVEDVYKAVGATLTRSQVRWVLQYASSHGYGSFDEKAARMVWNERQIVAVARELPELKVKAAGLQTNLFERL